jgi:hypothetical protein
VAKLTGVEPPSSGALESPRIGSDSSMSKALRGNERIRGIVRRTAKETLIRCTIIFVGDTAELARLGQRIDFRVNDSTGFITFPVDLLPALSVLEGMKELCLGGAQEFYKPDPATLIDGGAKTEGRDSDSGTTQQSPGTLTAPKEANRANSKPAWVDPDIIRAYEKVTGKSFADEVANLTGGNLGALQKWYRAEWPWQTGDAPVSYEKGRTVVANESDYLSVITQHSDGMYLHVYIELEDDIPELESIDPRVTIDRIGGKIFRAGNTIVARFPLMCLPEVSCVAGVSEIRSPGEVQVPRPIKIQIEDRVKTQKAK